LRWLTILLLTAILGVGCGGAESYIPAQLETPPIPFTVAFPASLGYLEKDLSRCADEAPGLILFTEMISPDRIADSGADVTLGWGFPPGRIPAILLGEDALLPILHPQNDAPPLSADLLAGIYSGAITDWAAITGRAGKIEVWSYPPEGDLAQVWLGALIPGETLTPEAWLAPDPPAMLAAVEASPLAIGYLPARWLTQPEGEGVQTGAYENEKLANTFRQPLYAVSRSEPQGELGRVLACLRAVYQPGSSSSK
jgi:hypothetical protein